jgi:hypothetical protein
MSVLFFWVVMPCGLIGRHHCFIAHGMTTQKKNINIPCSVNSQIAMVMTTLKRFTEWQCPRRIPPTEKKSKPTSLQQAWQKRRHCVLLSGLWCCSVHWWVFWGQSQKKKKILRQYKMHVYNLLSLGNSHAKFHSKWTKSMEVISVQYACNEYNALYERTCERNLSYVW